MLFQEHFTTDSVGERLAPTGQHISGCSSDSRLKHRASSYYGQTFSPYSSIYLDRNMKQEIMALLIRVQVTNFNSFSPSNTTIFSFPSIPLSALITIFPILLHFQHLARCVAPGRPGEPIPLRPIAVILAVARQPAHTLAVKLIAPLTRPIPTPARRLTTPPSIITLPPLSTIKLVAVVGVALAIASFATRILVAIAAGIAG